MTAIDNLTSQQFYHGTKADLKPGDLIGPGYNSNYGKRKTAWTRQNLHGGTDRPV